MVSGRSKSCTGRGVSGEWSAATSPMAHWDGDIVDGVWTLWMACGTRGRQTEQGCTASLARTRDSSMVIAMAPCQAASKLVVGREGCTRMGTRRLRDVGGRHIGQRGGREGGAGQEKKKGLPHAGKQGGRMIGYGGCEFRPFVKLET
jgi:hypothetical protein